MTQSAKSDRNENGQIRVVTIVGARPQFVKLGPLVRGFEAAEGIQNYTIHTGQHYDANMSDVFFDELEIPAPDYHLGVAGGRHGQSTGRMLEKIEDVILEIRPHAVIVVGDTNSTLAGAIAASKLDTLLIHVESGLRSNNREMPEEINRIATDHLSDLLFAPTQVAIDNLRSEGITRNVELVGDPMYDATLFAAEKAKSKQNVLDELGLRETPFAVLTLHRAENTGEAKRLDAMLRHAISMADGRRLVFPIHPRTRNAVDQFGLSLDGCEVIEPLGYFDTQALLSASELVLTDSGGVQREAYFHRRPCITLRDETEWTETIDAGWNRLWTETEWSSPRHEIPDYGNGDSAGVIVGKIVSFIRSKATDGA